MLRTRAWGTGERRYLSREGVGGRDIKSITGTARDLVRAIDGADGFADHLVFQLSCLVPQPHGLYHYA